MASLLQLPHEILVEIVKTVFSRVPRTGNEIVVYSTLPPPPNWTALSRLSRTCRHLRELGQVELFSAIKLKADLAKVINLILTLLARPDLAAAVREVTAGVFGTNVRRQSLARPGIPRSNPKEALTEEWRISPEDAATLNEVLRRFDVRTKTGRMGQTSDDGIPLEIQAITTLAAPRHVVGWYEEHTALAVLAILLSPNVERVAISTNTWTLPDFAKPAGTFDNLAEFSWEPDRDGSVKIDSTIDWLLSAAPNLECFHGFIVSDFEIECSNSNVTTVVMGYSSLPSSCFDAIVMAFPNLQDFTYTSDTPPPWWEDSEATPTEIIKSLLKVKDTLTSLSLDWNFAPDREEGIWEAEDMSLLQLKKMVALEYLSITCDGVIPDDDDSEESESESESDSESGDENGEKNKKEKETKPPKESCHVRFLKTTLPPNLITLDLKGIPNNFDIIAFADIAPTLYPLLNTIYINGYEENLAGDAQLVAARFKEKGIDLM